MNTSLPKIVLAAVLKPIGDTRMFEKFALALSENYEVHIIGFESELTKKEKSTIIFHPIFQFSRKAPSRLQATKQFLNCITAIEPDLLIVHAVELLAAACWYTFKHKNVLCYDVRENYWRNVIYQNNYSKWVKWPLAMVIRSIEWLSRLVVKHYILAEKCYAEEFSFAKGKYSILENKYKPMQLGEQASKQKDKLHFVYTGTISTVYGAQEAFVFMEKLVERGLSLQFTMIGKVAHTQLGSWLANQAMRCNWFNWKGASQAVPHQSILEVLSNADYALLPYQLNRSTKNCIPTKMYECMGMAIPMIIQKNDLWEGICQPHQAGVFIDFQDADMTQFKGIDAVRFYPNGPVQEAFWEDEVLLQLVEKLIA